MAVVGRNDADDAGGGRGGGRPGTGQAVGRPISRSGSERVDSVALSSPSLTRWSSATSSSKN